MGGDLDWNSQETNMILTIDNLAHRYKMLPSQALEQGNTFDLYVLDVSNRFTKRQHDIAQGNQSETITPKLSLEEMQAMVNKVKERKK